MTDPEIRGLTLRNPWPWAIAHQAKDVENRTWQTRYRGLLAIHAGQGTDLGVLFPTRAAIRAHLTAMRDHDPALKVRSAIVAVAQLAGCHTGHLCVRGNGELCSPWAAARQWHWELTNVTTLAEPVPCKGAQGLWRLPADVEVAVRNQIRRTP